MYKRLKSRRPPEQFQFHPLSRNHQRETSFVDRYHDTRYEYQPALAHIQNMCPIHPSQCKMRLSTWYPTSDLLYLPYFLTSFFHIGGYMIQMLHSSQYNPQAPTYNSTNDQQRQDPCARPIRRGDLAQHSARLGARGPGASAGIRF